MSSSAISSGPRDVFGLTPCWAGPCEGNGGPVWIGRSEDPGSNPWPHGWAALRRLPKEGKNAHWGASQSNCPWPGKHHAASSRRCFRLTLLRGCSIGLEPGSKQLDHWPVGPRVPSEVPTKPILVLLRKEQGDWHSGILCSWLCKVSILLLPSIHLFYFWAPESERFTFKIYNPSLSCCATLDKLFNLFELQCFQLSNSFLHNVCMCMLSGGQLLVTPWTVAYQAPLSLGFSRQEYWSGLPFPSPGDLPDPGIEPASLMSPALAGGLFTTESPGKPILYSKNKISPCISIGLVAKLWPTLVTPCTVTQQAPLSMEFSKQEYWSGLPFPSPGDLPHPETELRSPALQAVSCTAGGFLYK